MIERMQCKTMVKSIIDKYEFKTTNELYNALDIIQISFEENLSKLLNNSNSDTEFIITMTDIMENSLLKNKDKYPSIKEKIRLCEVFTDELTNLHKMNERGYNEKFISLFKKELCLSIENCFIYDEDIIDYIEKIQDIDNDSIYEHKHSLLYLPEIDDIDLPFDIYDVFENTLKKYLEDVSEKESPFIGCIYCSANLNNNNYITLDKEEYKYDNGEDFKFCDISCVIGYLRDLGDDEILK